MLLVIVVVMELGIQYVLYISLEVSSNSRRIWQTSATSKISLKLYQQGHCSIRIMPTASAMLLATNNHFEDFQVVSPDLCYFVKAYKGG